MTPQERQLIDELFNRLSQVENAPRDPDAMAAIADGLRKAPNAVYALVQTALLQDEALKRANSRIEELEAAHGQEQSQPGGFLDSMRDTLFGSGQSRGSVPNVRPPESGPVWNSGQVMQQAQPPGYGQAPGYGQGGYGQPPAGGGSFLGSAAATAAGMIGGSLLLNSIRSMMGGQHQAFANTSTTGDRSSGSPWSDQSGSSLARDAGVGDIGSQHERGGGSRQGLFDQASNDDQSSYDDEDDHNDDDDGFDGDDFGDDDGSDYA